MMSTPKVSVIIPAYNAKTFLRECLESIINQSYTNWECIVVNDGSTDETPKIADEFIIRDSRFRVINTENKGVAAARNTGIENAEGTWITFVDSDDCLTSNALEFLLKAADASNAEIVIGEWRRNKPDSAVSSTEEVITKPAAKALESALYQASTEAMMCGKLFRRDIMGDVRFRSGTRHEDLDCIYLIYERANTIAFIPDVVYFYRDNPNSFINHFSEQRFDLLEVTRRIEEYFTEKGDNDLARAARDRRLDANFRIFGLLMAKTKPGEYTEQKDACWNIICSYRNEGLKNPRVSIKNKLGAIMSKFGRNTTARCFKLFFR